VAPRWTRVTHRLNVTRAKTKTPSGTERTARRKELNLASPNDRALQSAQPILVA